MLSGNISVNINSVDYTYTVDDRGNNISTWFEDNYSFTERDQCNFYRTLPKSSGNYRGNVKGAIKLTKDVEVSGIDGSTTVAPVIINISASIPVGVTEEEAGYLVDRALAIAATTQGKSNLVEGNY